MVGNQTVVEATEDMSVEELLLQLCSKDPPAATPESPLSCNGQNLVMMEKPLRWYGIRDDMKVAVQMLPGFEKPRGKQTRKRMNQQAERERGPQQQGNTTAAREHDQEQAGAASASAGVSLNFINFQ